MTDVTPDTKLPEVSFSGDDFPDFEKYIAKNEEAEKEYFSKVANPEQQKLLEDAIVPVEINQPKVATVGLGEEDDSAYRINPPYGIIGLASKATSKEQIEKMMDYCLEQSVHFLKNNDFEQSRLYGLRYRALAGILSGAGNIKGDLS